MEIEKSFFEEEVRHGFYINPFMKRCWAAQMEVLYQVDRICCKYNIRWFAHYGTMLGAVRHGGFVPWDDDMDICMLREDFNHFAEVLKKEDTELRLYSLRDDCEKDDFTNMIARVMNADHLLSEKGMLEKYHQCFFASGIDIFILDYISQDKNFEENRKELAASILNLLPYITEGNTVSDEIREGIEALEALFNRKIDWNKSLERQLFQMIDALYSECPIEERSDGVALLQEVYNQMKKPPFHVKGYDSFYEVPFEMMKMRLSRGFLEMIKIYYYNFAFYRRDGGGHSYPFYEKQYDIFTDKSMKIPFSYQFTEQEFPNRIREGITFPKDAIRDALKLSEQSFCVAEKIISSGGLSAYSEVLLKALEAIQQLAIQIGQALEAARGSDFELVREIEHFIEEVYQYYIFILHGNEHAEKDSTESFTKLKSQYVALKNHILSQYLNRKEILIIPYRAKYWYAMQTIYEKYAQDENADVHVMPVPLYERDALGKFVEAFYEGDQYPEEIEITDYHNYDCMKRVPDVIYIGSDYDGNNPVLSIEPSYYSANLLKCTPKLILVPFMLLDENLGNDWLLEKELKLAGCQPGMMHADEVYVQSENIKQHFLNVLKDFAGEEQLPFFEKKLVADRYPVISYIQSFEILAHEKSERDFYYLSIAGILYEGEMYLEKFLEEVEKLLSKGDRISLVLEERANITLKIVDEALYEKTVDTLEMLTQKAGIQRLKEPEAFEAQAKAVAQHDAYYGDPGPMTWLFQHFQKTVKINTVDYNKV